MDGTDPSQQKYTLTESVSLSCLIDTWFLWRLFGWTAPVACYAYFLIGVVINSLWLRRLVQLVYQQVHTHTSNRSDDCMAHFGLEIQARRSL